MVIGSGIRIVGWLIVVSLLIVEVLVWLMNKCVLVRWVVMFLK